LLLLGASALLCLAAGYLFFHWALVSEQFFRLMMV